MAEDAIHRALGLTDDEAASIERILGREPNHLELAMFAVMWSEHCSYKSSRILLRRFPSEAQWVLVGPGEGAGVVDVGDGIGAALRIESHNHPSAIEPYQGAATGVGGILRDVFSMGARPIAVMDPLRFGPLEDARSRWVAEGVVAGISGYGNSVGVPTVGGEVVFDETFADNPLVNVLCLGLLPKDRLVLARASGVGNVAVLLGSSTGRDGIGGVSVLASAGFGEGDAAKRPSVQVGDPFEEKRLIEACLELLDRRLAVGVQDLGGAGLTCATSETASKGGAGMDVYLSAVRQREPGMEPFEVMTSESQERMLAIVTQENLDEVLTIARRWEVDASVVGTVTASGRLRVLDRLDGEVLADVPARALEEEAPRYERPRAAPEGRDELLRAEPSSPTGRAVRESLLAMVSDVSWIWSQYDHQLFLNTVVAPGGDAAVLRLKHPTTGADTGRGLALTTDGNHRWCAVDPRGGAANVVAEAVLNLACVGARPVALVNCLNFGNPEHPEVMWQLAEAIDGISEACREFGVPVVGGNVSLYNESRGRDIDPTPIVGVLGVIDDLARRPPAAQLVEGCEVVLLGTVDDVMAGSWHAWRGDERGGRVTAVDFPSHEALCDLVRSLVADDSVVGVHDVADGGIGLALLEMAIAGHVGLSVPSGALASGAVLLSEAPSRALVCVRPQATQSLVAMAQSAGVPVTMLGVAAGDDLTIPPVVSISVAEAVVAARDRLPAALGHGTTQA